MSVRMALAKLCACTCGGAIIGGGAVHVAENPPPRPAFVKHAKAKTVRQRPRARVKTKVRRIARTTCVVTQPGGTVTTRTFAYPPPIPPLPPVQVASSSGGVPVAVIGGSGGFGSGRGFGSGFFSGSFVGGSSSGNNVFTASTSTSTGGSTGSSTSTSGGSTSTGGSSTSTGGSSTSTGGSSTSTGGVSTTSSTGGSSSSTSGGSTSTRGGSASTPIPRGRIVT